MYRPFSLFAGLRYTIGRRGDRFVSLISLISLLGLGLGVAALIIVLAIMNGFQQEIRDRMLAMVAHASVTDLPTDADQLNEIERLLSEDTRVTAIAPYQSRETLVRGYRASGARVRGIDPQREQAVSEVAQRMQRGQLDALQPSSQSILLGEELARALGVGIGDRIMVFSPELDAATRAAARFRVAGTFAVGMREYDRALALIHLDDAPGIFGERGRGLRLMLNDRMQAAEVSRQLQSTLTSAGLKAELRDWTQENPSLFQAMAIERVMMFIILSLIILVAAFNILASLSMAVNERRSDIAILRTMGARPYQILAIFLIQGWSIGILGSLAGLTLGLAVALNLEAIVPWIEQLLGIDFMPADMFYISELPADVQPGEVTVIALLALGLSLLATLYPSWRASRQLPARALHAAG
jgi:lipoprotein-releasing system permease protein